RPWYLGDTSVCSVSLRSSRTKACALPFSKAITICGCSVILKRSLALILSRTNWKSRATESHFTCITATASALAIASTRCSNVFFAAGFVNGYLPAFIQTSESVLRSDGQVIAVLLRERRKRSSAKTRNGWFRTLARNYGSVTLIFLCLGTAISPWISNCLEEADISISANGFTTIRMRYLTAINFVWSPGRVLQQNCNKEILYIF